MKRKWAVATCFSLTVAGLILGAHAEEQQQVKQAKKPAAPQLEMPTLKFGKGQQVEQDGRQKRPLFLPELTPFEKEFQDKLNENVEANFVDTPLKDVINFYADSTNTNFVIFENMLGEEGLTLDEPISISLDQISLKTALELMLEPIGLTYVVDRDVVKITTILHAEEMLKTRVYPVGDLGGSVEDYLALEVAIRNAGLGKWRDQNSQPVQAGGFGGGGAGGGFFQVGGGGLGGGGFGGGFSGGTFKPEVKDGKGGTITVVAQSNSLVISQTYQAHNAIVDLLTQLRQARSIE